MKLQIHRGRILFPTEFLGPPHSSCSWIAQAQLSIEPKTLVIHILRKPFVFEDATKIYDAERQASVGFFKKGSYKIHRTSGMNIVHHIQARDFFTSFDATVPEGSYEFEPKILQSESGEATEIEIRVDLASAIDLKQVRSMLIGYRLHTVH